MSKISGSHHRTLTRIATGAAGGLAASWAMGQFESLWRAVERAYLGPPADAEKSEQLEKWDDSTAKTARSVASAFGHELTESESRWAAPAVHYLFGTAVGALYGALPQSPVRAGAGTAYGTAVWLAADEFAVPALGLNSANANVAKAKARMFAAHLLYGATTHFVQKLLLNLRGNKA